MHGGMVGNSVQPEKLIESQPEKNLQGMLLGPALGLARDQPVEGSLPADDAISQLLSESAIVGRQRRLFELSRENSFDVLLGLFPAVQGSDGNFSWFLSGHSLNMLAIRRDARVHLTFIL